MEFAFLSIGIFIISLFWWKTAPVPFEVPKVIFFQWFVRILVIIFTASFFLRKKVWKVNLKILVPVLIFAVWAAITLFIGRDPAKSFAGNFYRNDGLITFYELIGFSLLVSYFWKDKFKKIISLTFFASSMILSGLTLVEIAEHKFGLGAAATFGNPVFLAGYLVCAQPFYNYFLQSIKLSKVWKLLLCLLPVTAIVATGVSSAIAVLGIYWGIALAQKLKNKYRFVLILAGLVAAAAVTFFWLKDFQKEKFMSPQGRDRIYHRVFVGALQRPVMGWGWANVDYAFESNYWPLKVYHDVYVDKAHSEILEVFATTGIPGLVIYSAFIIFLIKKLIVEYKKSGNGLWNFTLLSTFVLYLFHSQTNVISITEQIIFWLVVGIVMKTI